MSPTRIEHQRVAGCVLSTLDGAICDDYLRGLIGEADSAEGNGDLVWMLGHFDDGVTWARRDRKSGRWVSGHDVAAEYSPAIRRDTLQELRLFGDAREVLIWRTDSGLRGREVRDAVDPAGPAFAMPVEESRVLRGDRVLGEREEGFTCVTDATGARQVLPMRVAEQQLNSHGVLLLVRHYFERDEQTGAVRVALTRLVKLKGGNDGA